MLAVRGAALTYRSDARRFEFGWFVSRNCLPTDKEKLMAVMQTECYTSQAWKVVMDS